MSISNSFGTEKASRRSFVCGAVSVLPAAAIAQAASVGSAAGAIAAVQPAAQADPIFAAIEAHKAAGAVHCAALEVFGPLQNAHFEACHALRMKASEILHELATLGVRRLGFDPNPEIPHTPEYLAAEKAAGEACEAEMAAFDDMVATVPTTWVGLVAMVEHLAASDFREDGMGYGDIVDTIAEALRSLAPVNVAALT